MDIKQYEKDAARTETSDYTEVEKRVFENYAEIKSALKQFVAVSKKLDAIKKKIIYGKKDIDIKMKYLHDTSVDERAKAASMARLFHGMLGVTSESGEVAEAYLKAVETGKDIDDINVIEECSDLMWYINVLLNQAGSNFETAADTNIKKLAKRYPDTFTEYAALNRDVKAERDILEENAKK